MEERIRARGHEYVTGTHESTFELTTDEWLTPAGDCILGIGADRAPADFNPDFVTACRDETATITASITVDDHTVTITGHGHPELTFDDERSVVGRTSGYLDGRTIMIDADAAAADIDRPLIDALADGAELMMRIRVV